MKNTDYKTVYFISFKSRVGEFYLRLAAELKAFNINLVPIPFTELSYLDSNMKKLCIFFTNDISSISKLYKGKKGILSVLLRSNKFSVIHISSFSKNHYFEKFEHKKIYKFHRLPIDLDEVIDLILNDKIISNDQVSNKWIGKSSGRLPTGIFN